MRARERDEIRWHAMDDAVAADPAPQGAVPAALRDPDRPRGGPPGRGGAGSTWPWPEIARAGVGVPLEAGARDPPAAPAAPGDLVGVCAPAGAVDRERLAQGVAELEGLGFRVRVSRGRHSAGSSSPRARGPAPRRAARALRRRRGARPSCARGAGPGPGPAAPARPRPAAQPTPRRSSATATSRSCTSSSNRLGLVTLHGPMVAGELASGSYDRGSLRHAPRPARGALRLRSPTTSSRCATGEGEGLLRGGCLSILAAAAGTPWALAPAGEGHDPLHRGRPRAAVSHRPDAPAAPPGGSLRGRARHRVRRDEGLRAQGRRGLLPRGRCSWRPSRASRCPWRPRPLERPHRERPP